MLKVGFWKTYNLFIGEKCNYKYRNAGCVTVWDVKNAPCGDHTHFAYVTGWGSPYTSATALYTFQNIRYIFFRYGATGQRFTLRSSSSRSLWTKSSSESTCCIRKAHAHVHAHTYIRPHACILMAVEAIFLRPAFTLSRLFPSRLNTHEIRATKHIFGYSRLHSSSARSCVHVDGK